MGRTGTTQVGQVRNDYSGQNVGTSYVVLTASLGFNCNHITVFDSGGTEMVLAYGPTGSEVVALNIPPGGFSGKIPCLLHKGMQLQLKSTSGTMTSGVFLMQCFV